jgi:hypothetical protein
MFGDDIRITSMTRGDRFVITQPTLRGAEPSKNEIRDVLEAADWRRVPPEVQDLPIQLMGSAWWHLEESLVILDARKPNFKKTDYGVLPIDLILADLTEEMRNTFSKRLQSQRHLPDCAGEGGERAANRLKCDQMLEKRDRPL